MLLTDILEKNVKEFSDRTALTMRMGYRTVSLSYQTVYKIAKKIAVFLDNLGLQKGDKVLILAPNSPYWICVWWGCLSGGYIPVPLNTQSTGEMIRKITEQSGAKIIFKYLHWKQELPPKLKSCEIEFLKEYLENVDISKFQKPIVSENDVAELMYTSGTTGDPKGVILTHKNIISNLAAVQEIAPLSGSDKFLSILPLSHIFEQVIGFLLPFSKRILIVYAHSPAAIRDLLSEHGITIMAAVPEFLKIMMAKIESQAAERGRKRFFENLSAFSEAIKIKFIQRFLFWPILSQFGGKLHTVISGGAPLDAELERKWSAMGVYLLQGYGLTETSPVISTNDYEDRRMSSVGKIISGVKVKIAEDGEIRVKGPNVFQGYFKNEAKTKEAFTPDGWFMTGDIGEIDRDGFLYIRGRKKYMIKGPGAQNVYPEDIEFELNKVSGIKDSCVVGIEKAGGKAEIHAVLLGEIKDPEKVIRKANENLASYQQIAGWSVWPENDFPRSATRKVKKEEVLKRLRERKPATALAAGKAKTPLMRLLAEITDHDVSEIHEGARVVPELNLDSLLRIELVARIEEKFGVTIDEAKIDSTTSVSDLEEMVKKKEPLKEIPPLKRWPRFWLISLNRLLNQTLVIFPLIRIFVKLKIEGKEHFEKLPLPAIFMPNHVSYLDSVALVMALPFKVRKRIVFAAAEDVLYEKYRRIAWLAEIYFNSFPFPRQEYENIKVGLDYFGRLLDEDYSIAVYPEGKMSLTGELEPLKRGAGLIAVEMDAYIVPVKIIGTAEVLPLGKFIPRKRGEVIVKFGKPLKFKKSDSYIEATEKIQDALQNL